MFYTDAQMTQPSSDEPITHRAIIDRAGGPAAVGREIAIDANTTKAWRRLDSIPAPHWQAIAEAGIATLDELAEAAARRSRLVPVPAEQADAA